VAESETVNAVVRLEVCSSIVEESSDVACLLKQLVVICNSDEPRTDAAY
jgi:hypothetical protein